MNQLKSFRLRLSPQLDSMLVIDKKKIKQNAFYDAPLLKTLEVESRIKGFSLKIEIEKMIFKEVKLKFQLKGNNL